MDSVHSPSLFMPACKHLCSLQAWHWFRWALSTTHVPVPVWHLAPEPHPHVSHVSFERPPTGSQNHLHRSVKKGITSPLTCRGVAAGRCAWRTHCSHCRRGFHSVYHCWSQHTLCTADPGPLHVGGIFLWTLESRVELVKKYRCEWMTISNVGLIHFLSCYFFKWIVKVILPVWGPSAICWIPK